LKKKLLKIAGKRAPSKWAIADTRMSVLPMWLILYWGPFTFMRDRLEITEVPLTFPSPKPRIQKNNYWALYLLCYPLHSSRLPCFGHIWNPPNESSSNFSSRSIFPLF
jgi:hypothetical protein